jgi:hypothetical protein
MIEPPSPASIISGAAASIVFQTPVRLMSIVSCHRGGVERLAVGIGDGRPDAGIGAGDIEAPELGRALGDHRDQPRPVGHVDDRRDDPPVERLDHRDGPLEVGPGGTRVAHRRRRRADVDGDDVGAGFRQLQRVRATLPARGSRHQGDLALQRRHRQPPIR